MPSTREIRRRIRSVKNISQVTRAMQMVAASKMRRAQEQVLATRPYTEKAWQVLSNLAAQRGVDETVHPLLQVREEIKTVGMVLITADKGLCGSYNHNMIQTALRFIQELPYPVELITVGKRGRDAMWRLGQTIVAEFSDLPPQPRLLDITPIARTAMDGFIDGQFDVVYLAHTDFINTLTQRPAIWQLLPIRPLDLGVTPVSEHRGGEATVGHGRVHLRTRPAHHPGHGAAPLHRAADLSGHLGSLGQRAQRPDGGHAQRHGERQRAAG